MRVMIALFLLCLPGLAGAEVRVALVLAAERYEALRPLANPLNDARAVEDKLTALGFDVVTETNRDLRRMRRALEDFAYDAEGADVALIYFAGHGMEVAGQNLLLLVDAPAGSVAALQAGALPLDEVARTLQEVAPVGLLILDACRSDPFGGEGRGAMALTRPEAIKPGLARIGRADQLLYAFSAAPGQAALDGQGENSPFTEALVRHLATPGLEIRQVLTLVQQDVYDRTRGRQLPYVESGLPSVVFAGGQSELPEREVLLLSMAGMKPDHRALIEDIASRHDMPLAPLFGAFLSAGLAERTREDQASELTAAAEAFAAVRRDLATLSSDDPRVNALRIEADAQLALGAFTTARAKLTVAAEIDRTSRESLRENYVARTLSEAHTHYLNGRAADSDLKRELAISDYERAAALFQDAWDLSEKVPKPLSWSADRLGEARRTSGDLKGARIAFELSLKAAKAGAAANPDDDDWMRMIAVGHGKLGALASLEGAFEEARAHHQAARDGNLELVARDPANAEHRSNLSINHENLGRLALDAGDVSGAQTAFAAALALRERLVEHPEQNAEMRSQLGVIHYNMGAAARAAGDLAMARQAYESALEIAKALTHDLPANVNYQRDQSVYHGALGSLLPRLGDLQGARRHLKSALAIQDRLVAMDAENTGLLRGKAVILAHLSDAAKASDDWGEARTHSLKSLEILSHLADLAPESVLWQNDVASAHANVSSIYMALNDLDSALDAIEAGMAITQALSEQNPTNPTFLRELSDSQNRLGRYYEMVGNIPAARAAYDRALELILTVAQSAPENTEWQRDLAIAYAAVGEIAMYEDDSPKAYAMFSKRLDISKALVAKDPTNLQWQHDLAWSHILYGEVIWSTGFTFPARPQFAAAIDILETLVDREGDVSAELLDDLALAHFRMSGVGDTPVQNLNRALEILLQMKEDGRLVDGREQSIHYLQQQLAKLTAP